MVEVFLLDALEILVLGILRLGVVVELRGGLSVFVSARLAKALQVINSHEDTTELRNLVQLLAARLFLVGFDLLLLDVDLFELRIKLRVVVVQFHDLRVHVLLVFYHFALHVRQRLLLVLKVRRQPLVSICKSLVTRKDVANLGVLV